MDGSEYVMIGKERKKQERLGGRVAIPCRRDGNLRVDKMDVGNW